MIADSMDRQFWGRQGTLVDWRQCGNSLALCYFADCSCHRIAGFLVDELQIWIWRHFLEVLPEMTINFFSKKSESSLLKMSFNIEYSCHTITNIKHGRRLSLQLMTNWSSTCNYRNACLGTLAYNSFWWRAIRLFNSLPNSICDITNCSVCSFKQRLDR